MAVDLSTGVVDKMLFVTLMVSLVVAWRPAPKCVAAGALIIFLMFTETLPYQSAVSFVPSVVNFALMLGAYLAFCASWIFWRSVSLGSALPAE